MKQQKMLSPQTNVSPIRVVKSISRWIRNTIAAQNTVNSAQAETWADALDHVAMLLEQDLPNPIVTDAPLDAVFAEGLRHDAGWAVAELYTKANKFASPDEAKENDLLAAKLLSTLNDLTIGVCRPTTQIINNKFTH